jgi:GTP cyclohydrolase I
MLMESDNKHLPDVQKARTDASYELSLEWVGMSRIETPIRFQASDGTVLNLSAKVEAGVNLVDPQARGIHMSRLYRQVVDELPSQNLTFQLLENLIEHFLHTHAGLSTEAEIRVQFDALLSRTSLKSGLRGYRSYPVEMRVTKRSGLLRRFLRTEILYSSTCPQSAALARHLVAQDFSTHFSSEKVAREDVKQWLQSPAGMAATPHAQRSVARLEVEVQPRSDYRLESLIDLVEEILATPVQTVVKREDEQEFARRNGTHLMFCEDAARQIKKALWHEPALVDFEGEFRHWESLHPHDAVARIRGRGSLLS